ncbi:unnamed protein product, partial [Penicillium salamii]
PKKPLSPSVPSLGPSKPFHSTFFYRWSTLLAIKIVEGIRPSSKGSVLMLTDRICVKYGRLVHLSEASAVRFVAEHTSIPVPKVKCAFTHSGRTYLVMERIKGDMIGYLWGHRSEESKAKLLSQLAEKVRQLRDIQPPEGCKIASVDGGSLFDCRLPGSVTRFGPFDTIQDFHRHLREGMDFDSRLPPEVQDLIKLQNKSWPLVFTHGDLSSLNILARGDEVVGIVDWETAGWYPSYWEYTTAYQVNPQNSFWVNEIDKFLDPLPEDLAMEQIRQKYYGAF